MRGRRKQISPNLIWLCLLFGFLLVMPIVASERGLSSAAASQTSPQNAQSSILPHVVNQPSTAPLTYHYGQIQDSQNIYAIFWLPSGSHFETSGNDLNFESLIERYFNDVGGSNLSKILVQYPDNVNGSPGTKVSFGGGFVDTTPYPRQGSITDPILGQDIVNEIDKIINTGALPTGINNIYYLFTANGINVCQDQLKEFCSMPTSQQPNGFCAFHSWFEASSVEPYVAAPVNPSGISGGCQLTTAILHSAGFPNNDQTADSQINLISQEEVDVQTDPLSNAWYDTSSSQEISSKCAGSYGTVNATDGHNIVMYSHKYIVQQEWSNALIGCTLVPPATSSATFTLNPSGASTPVSGANSFPITYSIGYQEFVLDYAGKTVTVHADPNTSVSVGPVSSNSNTGTERWCLNSACLGQVVPLSGNGQTATLVYYDLLYQSVYEVTSDSSQPARFAVMNYTTAPSTSGSSNSPTPASLVLNQFAQSLWAEKGTFASIGAQVSNKSSTERWYTPAVALPINQAYQIPVTVSYHQFLESFNFTLIGGTGTGVTTPQVSFIGDGAKQTLPVPTRQWADAGSNYTFQQTLGSSPTERWVLTAGAGFGKANSGTFVSETYYHQFQVFLSYGIVGNSTGTFDPGFLGTSFGTPVSLVVNHTPTGYWLDAGSAFNFTNPLVGSNSSQRWISIQASHGFINSSSAKVISFYHQFALNFSYKIVGGGKPPTVPYLNYSSLNATNSIKLSSASAPVWINAGSNFTVNSAMVAPNSTERWAFNSQSEFASSAGSVTITLYHQYQLRYNATIAGGGTPATLPFLNYVSYAQQSALSAANTSKIVWADSGTNYTLPSSLGLSSTERWITLSPTSRVVNFPLVVSVVYNHQFLISLGYSTNGNDPQGGPQVSIVSFGATKTVPANTTSGAVWVDAGTHYSYPAQLPGSGAGERWVSNSTLTASVNSTSSANPLYNHQYMVTISTNPPSSPVILTPSTGWVNAGQNIELSATGGRAWQFEGWQGIGPGSFSGNSSDVPMTVNSPITETAIVYAALTISAQGTGSVGYSFGNVTGTIPEGQTKIVFVPPGQNLNVNANPFPVFYAFSEWNGSMTRVGNSTGTAQNPYSFQISGPSAITGFFKINLIGVLLIPIVVIVTVVAVFLFRRRGRAPKTEEDQEESEDPDDQDVYATNPGTR